MRVGLLRLARSVLVGVLSASAASILALLLGRFSNIFVLFFVAPTQLLGRVTGSLIPTWLVYWLVPEGGATAGVLLVMACGFLFWSIVFTAIHFLFRRPKAPVAK